MMYPGAPWGPKPRWRDLQYTSPVHMTHPWYDRTAVTETPYRIQIIWQFPASISDPTTIAASLSYTVAIYSKVFSIQGIKLGVRQQLPNLAIGQFRFSQWQPF
jgi:hypothetical protein